MPMNLLLLILAFVPPMIFTIWIRNTEKYHRESWKSIFVDFLWGAVIATTVAIILQFLFEIPIGITFNNELTIALIASVLIAPITEEIAKPLGLRLKPIKKELDEPEDGFIHGATIGLGFSATENLLYGITFLQYDISTFLLLMIIRSFGGCFLHANATAITGYGYGQHLLKKTSLLRFIPYLIFAIIIHGTYNLLVSIDLFGMISGLAIALLLVYISLRLIRNKIKKLDESHP